MQGVGLDMIEVSRIKKSIKRVGFWKHIFGELEKEQLSKKKFNEVHGLEEKLKVAYNDVDLNLKILKKGY